MQIARFFIEPAAVDKSSGTITLSAPQQIKQIRAVLRLRVGDRIDLLDGTGLIYRCVIDRFDGDGSRRSPSSVICRVEATEQATGEPSVNLMVALPLLRNNRFEWALEKLTEIGATQIAPIILSRTVVQMSEASDGAKVESRMERWQAIAREAAEQCERAVIPDVVRPQSFADFVKKAKDSHPVKLISTERSTASSLVDIADNISSAKLICIAIGAEGGFTEEEIALSFAHGFEPVSLGRRILRAETAALYSATILLSRLDL